MGSFFLTLGIALVLLGLLLLVADLFIASGVLFVLSLASVFVGLVFLFKHQTTAGVIGLASVTVAGPTLVALLFRFSPLKRPPEPEDERPEGLTSLEGRIGRTLSEMRPAGVIEFDGRRVDGLTDGMMLERGRLVRCVAVRAGRVVVRPLGPDEADSLFTAELT